jgi:ABC-type Mn2+/Zn2+ transport system ATPase subunit
VISWNEVTVSYGDRRVLGPVTVEVADGEWLGLIGPNGSGKTTLLKTAVGVASHSGSVAWTWPGCRSVPTSPTTWVSPTM